MKASELTIRMPLALRSANVDLERRGIHGNQDIDGVTRGVHFARGEVELEAADARDGTRRGANFGGIVRERSDVVAVERHGIGELAAGDLHAVARVASKADDRLFDNFPFCLASGNIHESRHRRT